MSARRMTPEQRVAILEFLYDRKPWKWIAAQTGATKGQVAGLAFRNKDTIEDEQLARIKARNEEERRYWAAQELKKEKVI